MGEMFDDWRGSIKFGVLRQIVDDLDYWLSQPDLKEFEHEYILKDLKSKYKKMLDDIKK